MLKLRDLIEFQKFIESGGWAEAFEYAEEELRLEMIEKIKALLDAADAADKAVGEVIFGGEALPSPASSSSPLEGEGGS